MRMHVSVEKVSFRPDVVSRDAGARSDEVDPRTLNYGPPEISWSSYRCIDSSSERLGKKEERTGVAGSIHYRGDPLDEASLLCGVDHGPDIARSAWNTLRRRHNIVSRKYILLLHSTFLHFYIFTSLSLSLAFLKLLPFQCVEKKLLIFFFQM